MTRALDMADFGRSASTGAVLEQFSSPCDGSSITVQSGTYTVQNVTGSQSLTTTHADVDGSVIDYTPPTGTQTVIYTFDFMFRFDDKDPLTHFKLLLDNDSGTATEVTNARFNIAFSETNVATELKQSFRWAFNIGGSTTVATGRVATWTSARTIKLQAREYSSDYEGILHQTGHWDGGGTDQFSQPVIGIKALA